MLTTLDLGSDSTPEAFYESLTPGVYYWRGLDGNDARRRSQLAELSHWTLPA